ncbi:ribonucleoside-diphosphate reductase subunit alpha [Rickettsiales bacterium]|nr:ribonucleoside-diphosphate reductase subunit alpha [Rickettsiales bacterium]
MTVSIDSIKTDPSRDDNLTDFGKAVLADRYLIGTETFQGLFARVAAHYGDNEDHAQRLYDYMSKHWFMPATPILSNGGTNRGLPISCFLNESQDSLNGIVDLWNENVWLAARGGGIGSYWGNLRSIGETVRGNGKTSGIVPFIKVMDSMTLAISQGSLRRGSSAVYLPVSHPEIEEFLDLRRPTGGDPNRKALNIHHAIVIPDKFMEAVERDDIWELTSPNTGKVVSIMKARDLWVKILTARLETGEPYLLFSDNINKHLPESYKRLGLQVKTSNLCSEITLTTGFDHLENDRTAVCCLSSLNLEKWDEWHEDPIFIEDVMRMLDNVMSDFIENASPAMSKAAYSAMRERSVGLGVMGYHSFLQAKSIPIESVMGKIWNVKMFKHIREKADEASIKLAEELGSCPDAEEAGLVERFTHKMSIAPTASISIICGSSSPGIEPYAANSFTQKTLSGSFIVRNKNLEKLLEEKGKNTDDTWSSIATHEGSVQHLDFLNEEEKEVFKTAYEIDQRWIIEHAADRTPYICQAQSVNLFLPGNVHKGDLHNLHYHAWKKGIKSLYYCRSTSIQRAEKVSKSALDVGQLINKEKIVASFDANKYEECLSCQ